MIRLSIVASLILLALVGVVALQPAGIAAAACQEFSGSWSGFWLDTTGDFEASAGTSYSVTVIGEQGQEVGAQLGYRDSANMTYIYELPNFSMGVHNESGTLGTSPDGVYRFILVNPSAVDLGTSASWSVKVGCETAGALPPGVSEAEAEGEAIAYETDAGNVDLYGACVGDDCTLLIRFDPDEVVPDVDLGNISPGELVQSSSAGTDGHVARLYYLGEHHLLANTAVFQINQYLNGNLINDSILIFYNRTTGTITLHRQ